LQLELTDLQNVEEPQSEDLRPLVCTDNVADNICFPVYLKRYAVLPHVFSATDIHKRKKETHCKFLLIHGLTGRGAAGGYCKDFS